MLKFEGFKRGDFIKAYDFEPLPDREDRYIVGEVVGVYTTGHYVDFYPHYVVVVTTDTLYPESPRVIVNIPMETSMDFDTRVTKVEGR